MPKLIYQGVLTEDRWHTLRLAEDPVQDPATVAVPAGPVLVPLPVWLAQRAALAARDDVGVWLDSADDPEALVDDLSALPVIGVNFPKFADGRGYSTATLLRSRYAYRGQLRAIGDVLRDQFNYLTRCGFDALEPRADRYTAEQLAEAVRALNDFTQPYQASVAFDQPLFRRVRRAS